MNNKLEDNILPELHIDMNFLPELPKKKCKSSTNSPRTMLETQMPSFKLRRNTRDDILQLKKNDAEIIDSNQAEKIKGLEAIGLFSEFGFVKQINGHGDTEDAVSRRRTIHITDFMGNGNKMSLIRGAGGLEAYSQKKQDFQKESMLRELNLKKFFHHTEKLPGFNTPQNSPRVHMMPSIKKIDSGISQNQKIIDLDHIMEKCDEAMLLKPPKVLTKSISPRMNESGSEKNIKKKQRLIIQ